ncbi:MAG: T9SS type A sorting domain-containing protein [Bacteroidetes bacterium]|nr:T9SS type A sorting domain-containing protein [Bacteroidota bacterium]
MKTFFQKKLSTFIVFLIIFYFNTNASSQSGWVPQNSGTPQDLYAVKFVSSTIGWAVGDGGVILKTNNGGTNWILQNSGIFYALRGVSFISETTGYCCGDNGTILKTTNGGGNWIFQNTGTTTTFYSIYSISADTVLACGSGLVCRTQTGGQNWTISNLSTEGVNLSINFNSGRGWMGDDEGFIKRSLNRGISWSTSYTMNFGQYNHISSVLFKTSSTGWACGYYLTGSVFTGVILKTTSGGLSWSNNVTGISNFLWSISFANENTGWVSGRGIILRTTNGGENWIQQNPNTNQDLNSICFVSENYGWSVGDFGIILKTENGGVGIRNINSEIPTTFSLSQNYPNPFNPATKIKFDLVKSGLVKLTVYDILGKEVATLVNENLSAGSYETDFDGSNLPSGVYFYRIETNEFTQAKKMILNK